jgi:hypothetical protein
MDHAVAGGYTKDVHCARCRGARWVRVDTPEPYTCQRCRMALAGRPTDDPVGSPAQQAARKAAGARGRQRFLRGSAEPGPA